MPKNYALKQFAHADFIGGDWTPVVNELGELVGVQARGTDCTLYFDMGTTRVDSYEVRRDEVVRVTGNTALVPQDALPDMIENQMTTSNESTLQYVKDLLSSHYWGAVTIKVENGNVVHVRLEQNYKPNELPSKGRFHANGPNISSR